MKSIKQDKPLDRRTKANSRAVIKQQLHREDWEHFESAVKSADALAKPVQPVRKFSYR
jgi:hypothetical protein